MSNILLDAFYGLGEKINKFTGKTSPETEQGIVSEKFPELKLAMSNEDLLKLTGKWEKTWSTSDVKAKWQTASDENEQYWLGRHFRRPEADKTRAIVDNAIFESVETYLPQITRRNPESMATLAQGEPESKENLAYTTTIQKELGDLADELKLRLKLKKAGRHWSIYLVAAAKYGWDMNRDIPTVKIVRAQKLIFDPSATVDEDGYTGEYIGEYRKLQASTILSILKNVGAEEGAEKVITDLVKEELGTEVQFIEWWTDQYMCWTLGKHVLLKKKNPHWNYDSKKEAPGDPNTGMTPLDAEGKPVTVPVPGFNHFTVPRKPYTLLSVFNLGKQPVDDTSLIGQNLSNQDRINKRVKQIDKNADSMNGGMVVSLERAGLTKEQAKGVTEALRKGGTVAIPSGSVQDAIARMSAPGLPPDIYNDLADTRNRLKDLFGTRGSTPSGIESEKTVRGKLVTRGLDTDRIGGGVSEYLEQFADDIYNWFVQLLYVYDDRFAGQHPKIKISVKEGSLLPKDSTTIANQAIELGTTGKMALVDMYKRLDYPNPDELAANVWLEANAPELLFKDDQRVAQAIQMKQAAAAGAGAKPPSESINFKDLPPDGQAQMAAQAGIDLNPEAIAAHNDLKEEKQAKKEADKRSMPLPKISETAPVA